MRLPILTVAAASALIVGAFAQDAPPVDAAAAESMPVLMYQPRSFTIFFEHAEPQIPEEAESLLPQIAEIFLRIGYQAIAIECHSDNVASQAINIPLTEDRARRIKTELVRYGVPDGAVTAVGLGYSDPLVPDAASEVAVSNRRCVLTLT